MSSNLNRDPSILIGRPIQVTHHQWLYQTIKQLKPKIIVETGTGQYAAYAQSMCLALKEDSPSDSKFISYEIELAAHQSAARHLERFGSSVELHNKDMFSFFNDYDMQPDVFFLDAGDELLWKKQHGVHMRTIPGKDYGENSSFSQDESENLKFFLKVQNDRSVTGTVVILDDFLYGRGTYVSNYIQNNIDEFKILWDIVDVVKSERANASLCICRRR